MIISFIVLPVCAALILSLTYNSNGILALICFMSIIYFPHIILFYHFTMFLPVCQISTAIKAKPQACAQGF